MTWGIYARLLVGAALALVGMAVGWVTQGWRKDAELSAQTVQHQGVIAGIAKKTADTAAAVRRYEQAANAAIQQADKSATERIAKNDEENSRLRACIAAGTCGVRIVTRVVREPGSDGAADSTTGTVGDAAIELDQEAGLRVLDLRESVQLDAEKLDYLRAYAESCWRTGDQAKN